MIVVKKKIAVFSTGWCAEILTEFITGMQKELEGDNADIFLFLCFASPADSPASRVGELNIYNLPDLHDFDGAVIFGSGMDYSDRVDNILARCKEADIPVVIQGLKRDGISFVGADNYQAMKDLCEHVINKHDVKDIVFLGGSKDSLDSELRLSALKDYLREHNAENYLREDHHTNWENSEATRITNEICKSGKKLPDAFICGNDGLAMSVCVTLSENGYNVPEDVLVTGFDYIDVSRVFYPSIASVDQCSGEMGVSAVKMLRSLKKDPSQELNEKVSCKFIPGGSCSCFSHRNSDELRRILCRNTFSMRSETTYFNRKLNAVDSTILACTGYKDLKDSLHNLLKNNHDFEGESFHLILEPNFGLSIGDSTARFNTDKYSKTMDVIYSSENGILYEEETFAAHKLIPGDSEDSSNHLYIFLPLHEGDSAYGYVAFRDMLPEFGNHFLQSYYERLNFSLEKFRYTLTLEHINRRLLDVMNRDPLTGVNNRMAYENKEAHLQSEINSESVAPFAIAMFDINSLKLINDSYGHEAGDEYLLRSCHLLCQVFKHSPVYRVGGDEFIAVLTGEDYANRDALEKHLNESMSPYSSTLPLPPDYISAACGIAVYDPSSDTNVSDVVNRADEAMYKDKAAKKGLIK